MLEGKELKVGIVCGLVSLSVPPRGGPRYDQRNALSLLPLCTLPSRFNLAPTEATSDMQLGEGAGGANNLAIGGENLHEDLDPSWLRVLPQM